MNRGVYVVLLVLLLIVAGYFYFTQNTNTIRSEFSDFALEDTSSVSRMFISDFEGISADLTRQSDNTWKINDKYKARQDAIDLILKTVNSVKVTETVPRSSKETVIKSMAGSSIKVEIYTSSEKPAKVYYVGNPTQNHFGTYMLLEIDGEKIIHTFYNFHARLSWISYCSIFCR